MQAVAVLRPALAREPQRSELHYQLGLALLDTGPAPATDLPNLAARFANGSAVLGSVIIVICENARSCG